jgi:hypothetical protein
MTNATNERRSAPASADLRGSRAAAKPNKTHEKRTAGQGHHVPAGVPLFPLLLPWAQALIARATGPIPDYGSAEWERLPDSDPHKVAACVIASEAWRTYWSPEEHERRLRTELEASWPAEPEARWSPEVVDDVQRRAGRPSYAELSRRRGEPEAEARANGHRRRLGLSVEDRGDAPTHHVDGRPVRYRAPLQLVPNG